MMAAWNENEDSSSNEEAQEVANLCLATYQEEVNFENTLDFIFDELQDAFSKLMTKFKEVI